MITAMATRYPTHILLKFSSPDGRHIPDVHCKDDAEAMRIVYFQNRLYINEKVKNYLVQRQQGFIRKQLDAALDMANDLLKKLPEFKYSSLQALCRWVSQNEKSIKMIAPREQSDHYKFYTTTILPLIDFCRQATGELEVVEVKPALGAESSL